MGTNSITYLFCAFILSAITQFLLIKIAHKNDLFLDDNESLLPQKLHFSPTPRIGGLGIFLACLFVAVSSKIGLFIMISSIPAFVGGLAEDLFTNISPIKRLLAMFVSAILAIILLDAVVINYGLFSVNYYIGTFISVVAVLGLINGTNLIDGFNGLSSGICLIIFSSFSCISYLVHDQELLIINLTITASIVGFLLFNFPRGKIFLGDGGAYFLGFCMAVIAMLLVKRNTSINPFFVLLCICHPVIEVIFSFIRKIFFSKISPLHPDSDHIHQLIYRNLLKENNPLTTLSILPFIMIFNALAIFFYNNQIALISLTLLYVLLYTLAYKALHIRQKKISNLN